MLKKFLEKISAELLTVGDLWQIPKSSEVAHTLPLLIVPILHLKSYFEDDC